MLYRSSMNAALTALIETAAADISEELDVEVRPSLLAAIIEQIALSDEELTVLLSQDPEDQAMAVSYMVRPFFFEAAA